MEKNKSQKVYTAWLGAPPQDLPPEVAVRRVDVAVESFIVVLIAGFAILLVLLWRPLPLFGQVDHTPPLTHVGFLLKSAVEMLSGAHWFAGNWERWSVYADQFPFGMLYGRALTAALLSIGMAAAILWLMLKPVKRLQHVEGRVLKTGDDALNTAREVSKELCGPGLKEGFIRVHPTLTLPKQALTKHMLVYGKVGSGKTQVLLPILRQIFKAKHKAIIYDAKGDFTAAFPDALLVSPADARSAVWDIARDLQTRIDAEEFAAFLIPKNDRDPLWSNGAGFILTAIILSLQSEKGTAWGWSDFAARCALPSDKLYQIMLAHFPHGAKVIEKQDSATTASMLVSFAGFTSLITTLARAWGDAADRPRFSLSHWMRDDYEGPRQIILQGGQAAKLASEYIAAMVNVAALKALALEDAEKDRSLFFVLDEFTSLAKVNIEPLIDKGRSKGCIVILGLQDLTQLERGYGVVGRKTIPAIVGTHIVCQVATGETAEFVSTKIIGKRRIRVKQMNVSSSSGGSMTKTASWHEEERLLVLPSQLTSDLGPIRFPKSRACPAGLKIRAMVMTDRYDILELDWPITSMKKARPHFVPAAWMKPQDSAAPAEKPAAAAAPATGGIKVEQAQPATPAQVEKPALAPEQEEKASRLGGVKSRAVAKDAPAAQKVEPTDSPEADILSEFLAPGTEALSHAAAMSDGIAEAKASTPTDTIEIMGDNNA